MLVVLVVQEIADIEDYGLVAEVLPPMRRAAGLGTDLARLMQDRRRTVAGEFVDLAFRDEDQRRAVAVAVPGHDAVGLYGELAEPQLAVLELRWLFRQVDGAERRVGDADGGEFDGLAGVGLYLVGGATAGKGSGCENSRSDDETGDGDGAAEQPAQFDAVGHLNWLLLLRAGPR